MLRIFRDDSYGWFHFFMGGRLGYIQSYDSPPGYGYNNANYRAEFSGKLRKAKAAIPSGAQKKSILSVPRPSQTIHFGKWNLSSLELDTMLVTNQALNKSWSSRNPWPDLCWSPPKDFNKSPPIPNNFCMSHHMF